MAGAVIVSAPSATVVKIRLVFIVFLLRVSIIGG
jgi:hypothetical protein